MKSLVCVYQTETEVGYATRPLWEKIFQTTAALRILFCELDDEDLDVIDNLYKKNEELCIQTINDALDNNINTRYMS